MTQPAAASHSRQDLLADVASFLRMDQFAKIAGKRVNGRSYFVAVERNQTVNAVFRPFFFCPSWDECMLFGYHVHGSEKTAVNRGSFWTRAPLKAEKHIVEMRYVADRHRLAENTLTQVLNEA